jgi:hypothetical protein
VKRRKIEEEFVFLSGTGSKASQNYLYIAFREMLWVYLFELSRVGRKERRKS